MLSFGPLKVTGELAPIPTDPTEDLQPPPAATVDVFWGEAMVGTMARFDWFDTTAGAQAHSTYQFTSASGKTQIAGSERDVVLQRVTEILQGDTPNPAVLHS